MALSVGEMHRGCAPHCRVDVPRVAGEAQTLSPAALCMLDVIFLYDEDYQAGVICS